MASCAIPATIDSAIIYGDGIHRHPKYWGGWFVQIGDGQVKQTNLNIFYQLGAQLDYFSQHAVTGQELGDVAISSPIAREWLISFLRETEEYSDSLKDSRASAQELLRKINGLYIVPTDWNRKLTQQESIDFSSGKEDFEKNFERESRNIEVFTVLPKGIYSTRLLIEKPQNKFAGEVRSVFSKIVLYDLAQAGRCLAFETPTAVAFHMFRATQAVMHAYYETVASKKWPHDRHEWGTYVREIEQLPGSNKDVTARLREIGNFERNPTIHEDVMVSLEKAPILFELCSGVIYTMAVEIKKLKK